MKTTCIRIILVLMLLQCSCWLHAQLLPGKNYGIDNGLLTSEVYRVFQDEKGYLWFSTDFGVSKYDGRKFKNFNSLNGLTSDHVIHSTPRKDGGIWVCTHNGGLNVLRDGQAFSYKPKFGKLSSKLIKAEYISENELLIQENRGRFLKILRNDSIFTAPFQLQHKDLLVNDFLISRDGSVIYSTTEGLFKGSENDFNRIDQIPDSLNVLHCYLDEHNVLWGACTGGYFKFERNKYHWFPLDEKLGFTKIVRHKNNLFVHSYPNCTFKIDIDGNSENQILYKGMGINDFFIDNQESLWIATNQVGLIQTNASLPITQYPLYESRLIGASNQKKQFTVQTHNKIFTLDEHQAYSLVYENQDQPHSLPIKSYLISEDEILVVTSSGISIKSLVNDSERSIRKYNLGFASHQKVFDIKKVNNNQLFFMTENGIDKVWISDKKSDSFGWTKDFKGVSLFSMFLTDEAFWFGAKNGVYKVVNGRIKFYSIANELDGIVHNIEMGPTLNTLWVSTIYDVYLFDVVTGKFELKLNGHGKYIIHELRQIKNKLWIGTSQGLIVYDLSRNSTRVVNQTDGLLQREVLDISPTNNDSEIWLTHPKGLSKLIVDDELFSAKEPTLFPLHISQINYNGETDQSNSKVYDLRNRNLQFVVDALDFLHQDEIMYTYSLKLDGEKFLNEVTKSNKLDLTNLPPGNYTLEVSASSPYTAASAPIKFEFNVFRPYYQQWWFRMLLVVLIILTLSVLFWFLLRHYKKRENQKVIMQKRQLFMEYRSLAALMNPHFIFNTMNSIQYYVKVAPKKQVVEYINKFSKLIRLNFDNAKRSHVPISEEIRALELYVFFESKRLDNEFNFELNIEPDLDLKEFYIPSLLIQPFVENAIWHGINNIDELTTIRVSIRRKSEKSLEILIEDDGVGIDLNAQPKIKSAAIKLAKSRLEVLSKLSESETLLEIDNLYPEKPERKGTRVRILVPALRKNEIQ